VPAMLLRNVLQRRKLPSSHGTGANVADPAFLDDIVQGLHDLFSWCASIKTMNLENVDVGAQPFDALLHGIEDVLPAQSDFIYGLTVVCHRLGDGLAEIGFVDAKVAFREDDDLAAGDVVLLESLAYDAFGLTVRVDVGLSRSFVSSVFSG
jgi:hypothetical protein